MDTEPIRKTVLPAAGIVALATFLSFIGLADPVTWQTFAVGASVGLAEFAALAFGVEAARSKAWAPATVNQIVDAEAVIAQAESRA